jgi:hypothetical protein
MDPVPPFEKGRTDATFDLYISHQVHLHHGERRFSMALFQTIQESRPLELGILAQRYVLLRKSTPQQRGTTLFGRSPQSQMAPPARSLVQG